jgi:hypothetical protein
MSELNIYFKKIEHYNKKNPKSIIQQENVGIVIVGNDTDVIPQWFVNSANNLNIPSVLIQDGLFFDIKRITQNKFQKFTSILTSGTPKLLFLTVLLLLTHQYKRIGDGLGGCTQIHVWGTKSRDYFISKGVEKQKIIITGSIRTDQLIQYGTENNQKKFVLYAPTNMVKTNLVSNETMKNIVTTICSAILSMDDLVLIIKPHDVENIDFYKNLTKKFGSKLQVVDKDVIKLILNSHLLITNLSTTAIDALCMHKPVIIFLPHLANYVEPTSFPRDLISDKVVLYANDKDSLISNVRSIINGQNEDSNVIDRILLEYVGPRDGNSVYRTCLNITELLGDA